MVTTDSEGRPGRSSTDGRFGFELTLTMIPVTNVGLRCDMFGVKFGLNNFSSRDRLWGKREKRRRIAFLPVALSSILITADMAFVDFNSILMIFGRIMKAAFIVKLKMTAVEITE